MILQRHCKVIASGWSPLEGSADYSKEVRSPALSEMNGWIVRAYEEWFVEEILTEKRTPYFINVMFKPLKGPASAVDAQMHSVIVDWFYPQLCKRLERHPSREGRHKFLPRLFLFPDLPVRKSKKESLRDVCVNGGLHYNGVVLISQRARLKEPFCDHISRHQFLYVGDKIERIYVEPVTFDPCRVMEYSLKTLAGGRADYDRGIFLPKSLGECRPPLETNGKTRAIKSIQASSNVSDEVAVALYERAGNGGDLKVCSPADFTNEFGYRLAMKHQRRGCVPGL
jgi:hypothetical protein